MAGSASEHTNISADIDTNDAYVTDNTVSNEDVPPAAIAKNIDSEWVTYCNELVNFKNESGDCNVSTSDLNDSFNAWMICQRHCYMLGELSKEEIEILNSIGFDWAFGPGIFLLNHEKNGHAMDYLRILKKWYSEHESNLYPTEEETAQLASATGKTLKQIRAWFRKASEDQKKSKCVPPSAADALEKWYIEHSLNPLTKEEKVELISITDLDEMTIDNWFSMRRWRPDSWKLNNTDHLKSWF
ncbi:hypothetical protein ACHAXN_003664 [Cyclotella atomus]